MRVTVVGAGLAGCEAAFQLAQRGVDVTLVEQKPVRRTPAQSSDDLCELVCSSSLRGAALTNAVGLLKEELRRAGSLVLACADEARVPAGGALAVDRAVFARKVTTAIEKHPRVAVERRVVLRVPDEAPVVLATGPLTGDELAADLARVVGAEHLAYYDAIAPVVAAGSIDLERVFRQSRWDKGTADYLNAPMTRDEYGAFVRAVLEAEKVTPHGFEDARCFEGCLPIDVMAARGEDTLRFGPMKPVGLVDPRTGRRPWAVVQLRQEDAAGSAYNLVGFQTRMTFAAQARVLRTIPGLERCEILRYGTVHRNTFVDAPRVLGERLELRARPGVFLAGQLTGVEGYVESCASGFACAVMLAQALAGREVEPPPPTTAVGGQLARLRRPDAKFQPSNVTWACVPPMPGAKKAARHEAMAARALADLDAWLARDACLRGSRHCLL